MQALSKVNQKRPHSWQMALNSHQFLVLWTICDSFDDMRIPVKEMPYIMMLPHIVHFEDNVLESICTIFFALNRFSQGKRTELIMEHYIWNYSCCLEIGFSLTFPSL